MHSVKNNNRDSYDSQILGYTCSRKKSISFVQLHIYSERITSLYTVHREEQIVAFKTFLHKINKDWRRNKQYPNTLKIKYSQIKLFIC